MARIQAQLRAAEPLDEIPRVQRQPLPRSLQAFAEGYGDRRTAMASSYASGAYTLKALVAYVGLRSCMVSRAVHRAKAAASATAMHARLGKTLPQSDDLQELRRLTLANLG